LIGVRLLAISGSLRAVSSNTTLLQAAALVAPDGVTVELFAGLAELPPFNPDLDTDNPPPVVQAFRSEIGRSDGLLICSPEYAHGVPGVLKNALDWLVGSLEFAGSPVALISANPRSAHASAQLREILSTMAARLVEPASITVDLSGLKLDATGVAADPLLSAQLREALNHVSETVETGAEASD
jgi:NAD(P)H-dependent FMN reductase